VLTASWRTVDGSERRIILHFCRTATRRHTLARGDIMERTRFIEHQGHRILLLDYAGVRDPDEALRSIRQSMDVVARQPPGSLLVMTVVRDARYNAAVLQGMKELAAHNAPYVKASAVVGMSGLHRIAYQAVILFSKRNIKVFDQESEALDWLVSQA
jgi:hypothetical protein